MNGTTAAPIESYQSAPRTRAETGDSTLLRRRAGTFAASSGIGPPACSSTERAATGWRFRRRLGWRSDVPLPEGRSA